MQITAKTISEAWWLALYHLPNYGYRQDIDRGSFAGGAWRLQYPLLVALIEHPLVDMVPAVPAGVAPPSTADYVERYFVDYLIGGREVGQNEAYTYASRIGEQIEKAAAILAKTRGTNQVAVSIGRPEDLDLLDPACLREIHFKAIRGELVLYSVWRSNDLWAGFPVNLGGLAKVLQMVAEMAGLKPGPMIYASSGSHIYSYQVPMVAATTRRPETDYTQGGHGA